MDLPAIIEHVKAARADGQALNIVGGNSKSFLGYPPGEDHRPLEMGAYAGVIDYRPEELMIRARAGSRLVEIKRILDGKGQMLGFEPPVFSAESTLGGAVASGLSGSGRPYRGAARDFILGVGLVLQAGVYSEFGGQVMKNVAGYDVSRLQCGAMGILGVIADVSMKVLPKPEQEMTLGLELGWQAALDKIKTLTGRAGLVSAACYEEGRLRVRLSGRERQVAADAGKLGGALESNDFWAQLDSHRLPLLSSHADLWRLSTNPMELPGDFGFLFADWGFGQRWLGGPEEDPRRHYRGSGHWTRIRAPRPAFAADRYEPLEPVQAAIHRRLKATFDSRGIFNPGRMYPWL